MDYTIQEIAAQRLGEEIECTLLGGFYTNCEVVYNTEPSFSGSLLTFVFFPVFFYVFHK